MLAAIGFHNIGEADGWGIAVTGMLIVFTGLVLISMFIAALPRLTVLINRVLPPVHHHGSPHGQNPTDDESEAIAVAIGFALHAQQLADKR